MLGNISASKAGRTERNIENFAIYDAKEGQIIAGYNADSWTITNLQKGDIVLLRLRMGKESIQRRVPGGVINANPHLGTGGGEQFLIKNFGSSLKLTKTIELGEGYEYMPSYRPGH